MIFSSWRLRDGVGRVELRDTGVPARDPAQHIHLTRVGQVSAKPVDDHFEQGVRQKVLEVVDVGLHPEACHSIDEFGVVGVKGKLDVSLTELDLFVTVSGAFVERPES
jgi:hypothetical protein